MKRGADSLPKKRSSPNEIDKAKKAAKELKRAIDELVEDCIEHASELPEKNMALLIEALKDMKDDVHILMTGDVY